MSYQTVEVDLDNGQVRPRGVETLPAKARALLTIIEPEDIKEGNPPGISLADRVRHLAGIGSGEFTDLSTNKAHLDDLGT
jgi:hypothetical protein